jgi:hypothetical protein
MYAVHTLKTIFNPASHCKISVRVNVGVTIIDFKMKKVRHEEAMNNNITFKVQL